MNELYGQLSFITADPHVLSKKLMTLRRVLIRVLYHLSLTTHRSDPRMCERVRVLTIWPSAVREAVKVSENEKRLLENELQSPRPRSYFNKIGGRILGHTRSLSRPGTPSPVDVPLFSSADRLDLFLQIIKNLKNVDEFEINWHLDHGSKTSAWKVAFFPEIWQSIGHQLRCLTIDIQLFKLNDVVKSCGSLPKITELDLTLRCDAAHPQPRDTAVPYFINKFSATLQSLSVKTIGHQELSTDLQLLGEFPRLTRLSFNVPLDAQHLSDPSGLEKLLRNHPQVTDLSIRYSRCCSDPVDDGLQRYNWAHRLYSSDIMPALRALELGLHLPIPQRATENSMLHAISRMTKDLTSLTLVDRSLTLEEVNYLLQLFPGYRLRKLSLFARFLSPQLIDVIAKSCPHLISLVLDVQAVVKSEFASADEPADEDGPLASYVSPLSPQVA